MYILPTDLGRLGIDLTDRGLRAIHFDATNDGSDPATPELLAVVRQLEAYLAGEDVAFDIPLDLRDVPPFERSVLDELLRIPRGETRSYGDIARAIGQPGAAQAVGNAVGHNPIPIVIPCHRVIRSDGSLGNFSGPAGAKRHLLSLEGVDLPEQLGLDL